MKLRERLLLILGDMEIIQSNMLKKSHPPMRIKS